MKQLTLAQRTPDSSPFAILYQPRATANACTAPAERGPKSNKSKTQQAAMALETMAERKGRHAAERQKLKDSVMLREAND